VTVDSLQRIVGLLTEALREPLCRKEKISQFRAAVWSGLDPAIPDPVREVLRDLAYDLDYFEPDPYVRAEDATLYGHRRLELEIQEGLNKLRATGVAIPEHK
jgi:hypothetical protein